MAVRDNPSESALSGLVRPPFEGIESANPGWVSPVNVSEDDEGYLIEVELPGINKEDVAVTAENGVLTISGERKREKRNKPGESLRVEHRYGQFVRQFTLPEDAEFERITAKLKDGVLKVLLPKYEKVPAKQVEATIEENLAPDLAEGGDWLTKLKDDERAAIIKVLETTAQGVTKAFSEETDPSESAVLLSVVDKLEEFVDEKIAQKFATDNAFALAHLRGNVAKIEILEKAGPMLTATEAAEALNVSRQAVHKRIQSGSLFGMMYKDESRIP